MIFSDRPSPTRRREAVARASRWRETATPFSGSRFIAFRLLRPLSAPQRSATTVCRF